MVVGQMKIVLFGTLFSGVLFLANQWLFVKSQPSRNVAVSLSGTQDVLNFSDVDQNR